MIEFRWLTECSVEWSESACDYIRVYSDKKLQYKVVENALEIGLHDPIWSDWADIPEIEIDV